MSDRYKDSSLPIEERVVDLLRRMTLEEKVAQLLQPVGCRACSREDGEIRIAENIKEMLSGAGVGSLYGVLRADPWTQVTLETGLSPGEGAEAVNAIQRLAIENSRLGIPLIFNEECSHGHMAIGGTVFPVPLAMACTWNPELMERIMAVAAAETRAQGCTSTCSPIVDVSRDPRWGRTEETFGEDTFLCSKIGAAAVRGLQGESLRSDASIVATVKHYAHGCPEGGRNAAPSHTGLRELSEVFLPPYKAGIEAGAQSLMSSYNEIDGIPCSANRRLLTEILREEWGFEGFVISDLGAVPQLWDNHSVAVDLTDAAIKALEAGVDVELGAQAFKGLVGAVRSGKVSEELIDCAVSRVLRVKFLLGLFENPYCDPERAERIVGCSAHVELAREAARQSIVLLKNEGGQLPLRKDLRTVAVIGPSAASTYNMLGDYTAPQTPGKVITVLEGIRAKVSAETEVRYARGCGIRDTSEAGFEEALEAARGADVAVIVVGGSSARGFGPDSFDPITGAALASGLTSSEMECGEGLDRATLDLSGVQTDLVKRIHELGTPVVVVVIAGRPYSINWIAENVPAILYVFYPGQEGGNAIADVLFGDYCPSGKLPISIPRSVGQVPIHYSAVKSARNNPYVDMEGTPLYPFGFGKSYTEFRYENLRIDPILISTSDTAEVSVDVVNVGQMAGSEIVQLYIRDEVSSVTRPVKLLRGFQRVWLEPGDRKTVTFIIGRSELELLDLDMKWTVEPGWFTVMVGGSSEDVQAVRLQVE